MFDMGFTEMMLIGIVALVVIGPERLPGAARTAGKYFGKLKRFVSNVRHDVEAELRADELREIVAQQQQQLDSLKQAVSDVGKDVNESVSDWDEVVKDINENGGAMHKQAHNEILNEMNVKEDQSSSNDEPAPADNTDSESSKAKADTGS